MTAKEVAKKEEKTDEDVISRVYEIGYHILPTVKEEDIDSVVQGIRTAIEHAGGSLVAEGAPSLTRLAYDMEKREGEKYTAYDRAYFGWLKFEAATSAVHALESFLKGDTNILRSILFKTVREDTRAKFRAPTLREVKRTDTIKAAPRHEEVSSGPVSEEKLDKAIETLTIE